MSFPCPKCEGRSKALESRINKKKDAMRRRCECLECGERFTTKETINKERATVSDEWKLLKNNKLVLTIRGE